MQVKTLRLLCGVNGTVVQPSLSLIGMLTSPFKLLLRVTLGLSQYLSIHSSER